LGSELRILKGQTGVRAASRGSEHRASSASASPHRPASGSFPPIPCSCLKPLFRAIVKTPFGLGRAHCAGRRRAGVCGAMPGVWPFLALTHSSLCRRSLAVGLERAGEGCCAALPWWSRSRASPMPRRAASVLGLGEERLCP